MHGDAEGWRAIAVIQRDPLPLPRIASPWGRQTPYSPAAGGAARFPPIRAFARSRTV